MMAELQLSDLRRVAERAMQALQAIPHPDALELQAFLNMALTNLEAGDTDAAALALHRLQANSARLVAAPPGGEELRAALALVRSFAALAPEPAELVVVEDGVPVYLVDHGLRALRTAGVTPLHAAAALNRSRLEAVMHVLRDAMEEVGARARQRRAICAKANTASQENAQCRSERAFRWFESAFKELSGLGGHRVLRDAAIRCIDRQLAPVRDVLAAMDDPVMRATLNRRRCHLEEDRRWITEARAKAFLRTRDK